MEVTKDGSWFLVILRTYINKYRKIIPRKSYEQKWISPKNYIFERFRQCFYWSFPFFSCPNENQLSWAHFCTYQIYWARRRRKKYEFWTISTRICTQKAPFQRFFSNVNTVKSQKKSGLRPDLGSPPIGLRSAKKRAANGRSAKDRVPTPHPYRPRNLIISFNKL